LSISLTTARSLEP